MIGALVGGKATAGQIAELASSKTGQKEDSADSGGHREASMSDTHRILIRFSMAHLAFLFSMAHLAFLGEEIAETGPTYFEAHTTREPATPSRPAANHPWGEATGSRSDLGSTGTRYGGLRNRSTVQFVGWGLPGNNRAPASASEPPCCAGIPGYGRLWSKQLGQLPTRRNPHCRLVIND